MLDQVKLYNYKFIQNLYTITHTDNINHIAKALNLPNHALNTLIENSQIGNITKICQQLNISANFLFNYPNHPKAQKSEIDNDVIWHQLKTYNKNHQITMQQLIEKFDFDLVKVNRELPINLLYQIANHYRVSMNQIFNIQINFPAQVTSQKIFENVKAILNARNQNINQYATIHKLTYTAFSNLQNTNTISRLFKVANHFHTTIDRLLTYQVDPENQNLKFIEKLPHAPFYTFIENQRQNNQINVNQFLNKLRFTNNAIEKSSHTKTINALFTLSQDVGLSMQDIVTGSFNLKQIKSNEVHIGPQPTITKKPMANDIKTPEANIQKLPPETILDAKKGDQKPKVESVDELFDDAPVQSTEPKSKPATNQNANTDRLNRMFEKIKNLDANQILILNDLINSWQK